MLTSFIFALILCFNLVIIVSAQTRIIDQNPDDIHFYFYPNKRNVSECVELPHIIQSSEAPWGFSPQGPTRFIIHGYIASYMQKYTVLLKDALLTSSEPGNIIVVDWEKLSKLQGPLLAVSYPFVLTNVPVVAKKVTEFIINYTNKGLLNPEYVHLLGHSLGAHISGHVGSMVRAMMGIPIARITGLDPAGPPFWPGFGFIARSLSANDAIFVDVIHSNAGASGTLGPIGHVDFYPNGGTNQPGCLGLNILGNFECKHYFSVRLFAASISRPFIACQCPLISRVCLLDCKNPTFLGLYTPPTARGKFYLETSANP